MFSIRRSTCADYTINITVAHWHWFKSKQINVSLAHLTGNIFAGDKRFDTSLCTLYTQQTESKINDVYELQATYPSSIVIE